MVDVGIPSGYRKRKGGGFEPIPTTTPRGGGGGGAPRAETPFEKLARERGVDLPAEQARAEQQILAGQRIGGITPQTLARQAGLPQREVTPSRTPSLGEAPGYIGPQPYTTPPTAGNYDPTTGIYTGPQGQGFSMAEPPPGAKIISGEQPPPTIRRYTPDQVDRILSGEIIAPPGALDTIQKGQYESVYVPIMDKIKQWLGVDSLGLQHYIYAFGVSDISGGVGQSLWNMGTMKLRGWLTKKGVDVAAKAASSKTNRRAANEIIKKLEDKGREVLSGNILKGETGKAAAGVLPKEIPGIVKAAPAAINTATAATKLTFIKWVIKNKKYVLSAAGALAGWLWSGSFAYNELNDAIFSLSFKASDAIKAGDKEFAEELYERMEELDDLNKYRNVLGGPFFYIKTATTKGGVSVDSTRKALDRQSELKEKDANLEATYDADPNSVTPEELEDYRERNPYSAINAVETEKKEAGIRRGTTDKENDDMELKILSGVATPEETLSWAADNPFTQLAKDIKRLDDQAYYDEIDRRRLEAKAEERLDDQAYYANIEKEKRERKAVERLEDQAYYNALYGGGGGGAAGEWQSPSSLRFGLLHTAGGYQPTGAAPAAGGAVDSDEIANYLFGIPYAQLTDEQKAIVDKW